jgi:subtilase family serine protease
VLLATRPVPALAPGASHLVEEIRDVLSLDLPEGFYNVLVVIDHKDQVAESNEHNNDDCFWDEPRFYIPAKKADLACKTLGELIIDNNDLSYYIGWTTVINNGMTTAGASKIAFYISDDVTISDDDKILATQTIGELAPGASQMITPIEGVLDLDLAPGTYYVLTQIDYLNQVAETDEHNNDECYWDEPRFFIPEETRAPNLTCKERGFLTVNGNEISISSLKIINNGNDFSSISRVGIYLSENQVFSSTDILVGTVRIPKLSPGQQFNVNFDSNVGDLDLDAGTYFVGIIVDKDSEVEESDENDNKGCFWTSPKVTIDPSQPNLICESRGELVITNGTQLKFSWNKVKNIGDARAGNSKIGYYLSKDRHISTSDIFLGSKEVGSLEPGESVMPGAFNVDVSHLDLDDGYYYAGLIIDYTDKVDESNEDDNNDCSYDNQVHIDNSYIDLVCDSRGEVEVNGTIVKISWVKVKNAGNKKAPASKIGFYLSTDTHFSTSDFFIGSRNIEALESGEVDLISALQVNVADLDIPPGTYHIGSFIDYTKVVDEENEQNNNDCYFTTKVTIPQPKPDLTCMDKGELSINDNRHIHVSWTKIKNQGPGESEATKVGFYLSTDQNFTTSDKYLGEVSLPKLASGEVKLLSAFNKDISYLNLSPGKYYVGIIVDPHNTVHETNEHNNSGCSWSHPYIDIQPPKPNLTCMSKGEVSANGSTIHISWMKVQNDGGSTAGASHVGYYLSSDTHFSTSDKLIGSKYLSSIAAGQNRTVDGITINLSGLGLSPGEYYIGMIIDYKDDVHESNEHDNNDCFFHSPKVIVHPPKPNLTCMDKGELSVSGTTVHYSWGKVKNDGGTTAGAHHVGYYLSTDPHFGTNDYKVGEVYLNSLAAGSVRTLPAFNVDVADKNIPAGTYYFGIIIDDKQQVHESDEYDNNDCYFNHPKVTIPAAKPDLKCNSLGEISLNGDQLHLSWSKVMNAGSGASPQTRVGYYLSTNTSIDPSHDIYIGSRIVPALGAGQTATIAAINVNLANLNLNSGSYYIGYYIDDQQHVHESNEQNNTCYWTNPKYQKENGKPNLTLKNGSGHLSFSNNILHFSDIKVINYGNAEAGESKLGYYLSRDATIDPAHDILLEEDHISKLAPGAQSTESENISLSGRNLQPGTYYVGIFIDHKYAVHESNENDNKFRFTQRISIQNGSNGKPDLTCVDPGHLQVQNSNKRIRIEGLQVSNIGRSTANATNIGYYLSTDKTFTTDDYLIGTRTTSAILAGKTAVILFAEDIPNHIPSGQYYVGMIVDYDKRIHEDNENNNNSCYFDQRVQVQNSGNSTGGGTNSGDYCACDNYNVRTFCESFDNYQTGYLSSQSDCWTTWSGSTGGAEDGMVESSNGNQYLSIKANGSDKQDVLLQLGNRQSGSYSAEFKMWLFNGHQGYYNVLQSHFGGNASHAYEVFFNGDGTGYIRAEGRNIAFTYPTFEWFTVRQEFNLTTDKVSVIINGGLVAQWNFSSTPNSNRGGTKQLAAINFYPATAQNQFYIDDIRFSTGNNADDDAVESRSEEELPAPVMENATESTILPNLTMSYYPNPANEQLTVEFDAQQTVDMRVELVNAMGQIVMTYEEDGVSFTRHQFDLSQQAPGMYYIRAWAGDQQIVRPVVVTD